jgi:hypothetical protein
MLSVINARYTLYVYKWFQNLRSGFPLAGQRSHWAFDGVLQSRLDFIKANQLNTDSNQLHGSPNIV